MTGGFFSRAFRAAALFVFFFGGEKNPMHAGDAKTVYDFSPRSIDGETVSLSRYRGKVLLIVNTASRCGFTRQYAGLQELFERYRGRGLVVLGFPANDFMNQEPGDEEAIERFCSAKYGVTFPLFAKISVRGGSLHPLYQFLTEHPGVGGKITWNFNKFLIGRDGKPAERFNTRTPPLDRRVIEAVERALSQNGE